MWHEVMETRRKWRRMGVENGSAERDESQEAKINRRQGRRELKDEEDEKRKEGI